jgi:hypothetical protein
LVAAVALDAVVAFTQALVADRPANGFSDSEEVGEDAAAAAAAAVAFAAQRFGSNPLMLPEEDAETEVDSVAVARASR